MTRLAWRHHQPCLSRSTAASSRRCFATGNDHPDDTKKPRRPIPSVRDSGGTWAFFRRLFQRVDQFDRYKQADAFLPETSEFAQTLLFCRLNLPTYTEINLLEFLEGARAACQSISSKRATNEFLEYCRATKLPTDDEDSEVNGDQPSEEELSEASRQVAQELQQCLSPLVFKRIVEKDQRALDVFQTLPQVHTVEIQSVHLQDVAWDRLQRLYYEMKRHHERRLAGMVPKKSLFDADQVDPDEYVEVLQLKVRTTAKVNMRIGDIIEAGTMTVDWCFDSLVTDPDDLDWVVTRIQRQDYHIELRKSITSCSRGD